MIHTSDGETFEDEVGHVFGHDLMKDVDDTKMVDNKADLDIEPEEKNDFKERIEKGRNTQDLNNALFDMYSGFQRKDEKETMGLGPTQYDKDLREWGSQPLRDDDASSFTPGSNIMGSWNRIAMEPFDPSIDKNKRIRPDVGGAAGPLGPRGPMESIKSPAVKHSDTGEVYEGMNHTEAEIKFNEATGLDPYKTDIHSGYTTSTGRFVDRYEARPIAEKAGQIGDRLGEGKIQTNKKRDFLISEDLKHVQEWMNKKYAPVWEKIKANMTSVKDK